ncbi:hypothetical protein AB0D16_02310 [Streptomyces sp. NPDC048161]|uniref:hypothetical protein n=1 Tax=unclassified Streptomyces TaxID=2593676 RepID=UPI001F17DC37|nr:MULTISPECIES: hypothetical protein [unclassified Streptomyces]
MPTADPPVGGPAAPAPPGPPRTSGSPAISDPASPPDPASSSASGTASGPVSGSDGVPPQPEAQPTLAGREAGEGRLRPGRQLSPQELAQADSTLQQPAPPSAATDPEPLPAATPVASAPPGGGPLSPQALSAPAVQQVKQLSLGAGITLIGLGLGFLALRMRRSD